MSVCVCVVLNRRCDDDDDDDDDDETFWKKAPCERRKRSFFFFIIPYALTAAGDPIRLGFTVNRIFPIGMPYLGPCVKFHGLYSVFLSVRLSSY